MRRRDPFANRGVDNDPLGTAQTTERSEWGLPSTEGLRGDAPAELEQPLFDYSRGILVTAPSDADELAPPAHPQLLKVRTDSPHLFDLPHESTHRRYEPPTPVPISQSAAGTTMFAPTNRGLHFVKLLACFITLDAGGTLKFVQGSNDGTQVADLTGAMSLGGAAAPALQLAPAELANPWLFGAADQAMGIVTTTGKAQGWALIAYSPYDS